MTEPKRWSHPSSDVDPVLRSVARYAQELKPSDAAIQRLLVATAKPRRRRPIQRRFSAAVALGMAAALSGAAWARYGTSWLDSFSSPAADPRHEARRKSVPPTSPPPSAPGVAPSAAPAPQPSAEPARRPATASAPTAPALLATDAELLQQARAAVASNPGLALALTREHHTRFASSPLAEERQALRVEALWRLGRLAEAQQALGALEASFPRSPYRRRLRGLVLP
jgi:hypothetical protein